MSQEHHDALIAHAREEAPNECCGYMSLRDGVVQQVFRGENKWHSPTRFEFTKDDTIAYTNLEEEFDVGLYHSHPRSEAAPSQQDRNVMKYWPAYLQVIVSLTHDPPVRAWWITDRRVEEEPIQLT
jgi:[CysO sulfur-carrier protein]-S-L-cysteine hydrolase